MATFTLTGDIVQQTGGPSSRVTMVSIRSSHPIAVDGGPVLEWETDVPVVGGSFSVTLQRDALPTGYGFIVTAPQLGMVWYLDVPETGDADLSDAVMDALPWTNRADYDHGNVTGAVEVSAAYGVHAMTLTGDVELTPVGRGGADLCVFVLPNSHGITLDGAQWYGAEPTFTDDMAVLTFVNSPFGWFVFVAAVGEPVEADAPTFDDGTDFNDTGNVLTIPDDTGVQYLRNGTNISAGTYPDQSGGLMTITAVAKSGYFLPTGTFGPWTHTFAGVPEGTTVIFSDVFSRTVSAGSWGTPDGVGTAYSGADAELAVNGGKGKFTGGAGVDTPDLNEDNLDVTFTCQADDNFQFKFRGTNLIIWPGTGEISVDFGTKVAIPGWVNNTTVIPWRIVVYGTDLYVYANDTLVTGLGTVTYTSNQTFGFFSFGQPAVIDDLVIKLIP